MRVVAHRQVTVEPTGRLSPMGARWRCGKSMSLLVLPKEPIIYYGPRPYAPSLVTHGHSVIPVT